MTSRSDPAPPAAPLPFHDRSPFLAIPFLSLLATVSALAYLAGLWRDWPVLRLITKPIPILCLLLWVLSGARDRYARFIAAGLAFSMAGDVLLEFPRPVLGGVGGVVFSGT